MCPIRWGSANSSSRIGGIDHVSDRSSESPAERTDLAARLSPGRMTTAAVAAPRRTAPATRARGSSTVRPASPDDGSLGESAAQAVASRRSTDRSVTGSPPAHARAKQAARPRASRRGPPRSSRTANATRAGTGASVSSIGSRLVTESISPPNAHEQPANRAAGQLRPSVRRRKTMPANAASSGTSTCSLKATSHGRIRNSQESGWNTAACGFAANGWPMLTSGFQSGSPPDSCQRRTSSERSGLSSAARSRSQNVSPRRKTPSKSVRKSASTRSTGMSGRRPRRGASARSVAGSSSGARPGGVSTCAFGIEYSDGGRMRSQDLA
ncbi:MAG: hypothetical protein A2Y78_10065 [Acidobacteria bacterium RBG_13_68_16]|nr:MAG: hypothetical protein A2Y78_10065 [Acidobacteria bacterium RBG_13_68_16]